MKATYAFERSFEPKRADACDGEQGETESWLWWVYARTHVLVTVPSTVLVPSRGGFNCFLYSLHGGTAQIARAQGYEYLWLYSTRAKYCECRWNCLMKHCKLVLLLYEYSRQGRHRTQGAGYRGPTISHFLICHHEITVRA